MNQLPFFIYLQILQLEYYQPQKLLTWYLSHPSTFSLPQITPLKSTFKIKLLTFLSLIQYLALSSLFLLSFISFLVFLFCLILLFFTPLPLLLSAFILSPFELLPKQYQISKSQQLLSTIKPYVIGITGSFGKTTTKDFLFQILDCYRPTLKTTHSYNTSLGIAQSIRMGLTRHTRYFLAEFGAHYPGDIQKLTRLFPPQSAIITGIGPQHLERFKTITNILTTKFELAKDIKADRLLLNYDNKHIKEYLSNHPNLQQAFTYSLSSPQASFYLSHSKFDQTGSSFTLNFNQHHFPFTSPVFGTGNLSNLLAAVSQSILLHVPLSSIQKCLTTLTSAPHRLELIKLNQATIIDNTYSSNFDGFCQIISDLSTIKGTKALVTPGLVELGVQSDSFHQHLGQAAAAVFNQITLVGQNQRTHNFSQGVKSVKSNTKIDFIANRSDYWPSVRRLSTKFDWILLENDLPQNY